MKVCSLDTDVYQNRSVAYVFSRIIGGVTGHGE